MTAGSGFLDELSVQLARVAQTFSPLGQIVGRDIPEHMATGPQGHRAMCKRGGF